MRQGHKGRICLAAASAAALLFAGVLMTALVRLASIRIYKKKYS